MKNRGNIFRLGMGLVMKPYALYVPDRIDETRSPILVNSVAKIALLESVIFVEHL